MHVTILGGGGFRVPLIARQLAASALPVSRVVLYDTDPGRLSVIAAVLGGDPALAGAGGPRALPVTTSTRLDEALRGADVVFAALRPGGLDGRVRDERAALALGVLGQETVGAGGLASAARTVPAVDAIARRIAELAPGAWVISMTNPAGIVTEVMAATLGRRVIGVCDSPVGLIRRACAAAGADPGPSLGAVTERVDADYLGINHLGWLRGLRAGGADLLPALLRDPGRLLLTEEGRLFGADLPRALGALPNEYLYWYYANREALRDVLAAGRTRGEHVRERQQAFYAAAAGSPETAARRWQAANDERNRSYFAELRTGERAGDRDEADVAAGGYESVAVALASALTGGAAARLILNVPNGNTVPALAPGTVIEVPCRVDASGAVPLAVSAPSAHELGLMSAVRACERDIADAALIASAGRSASAGTGGATGTAVAAEAAARAGALALRAFAAHPLVGSLPAARSLAASVLADTGLASPGLASTGLAAVTREGVALTTAEPPTTAILPSYPIDIIDFSPGPWLISFSRVLPVVKWKSATAEVPGLTAAATLAGPARPSRAARSSASRCRARRRPGSAARARATTSSPRSAGSRARGGSTVGLAGAPPASLDLPVAGRGKVGVVSESAERYTIGQAARRVGVPARTIRFWCDSGLLPPAPRSANGYRRFDSAALAQLDLVRTLRDLGLGRDDIRAALAGQRSVAELARVHASALDAQIRVLRLRRAVLRVLAARGSDIEEAKQMNDLARLSARERQQIIDEFVDRTFAGTEPDDPAMNLARGMRALPAELPDDPSPEQVDAWIELAQLVADAEFGRRAREMVLAGGTARQLPEGTDYQAVTERLGQAVADGVDPASAAGRAVLDRVLPPGTPGPGRQRLLAQLETFTDERVERYWQLIGLLNGRPPFTPMVPRYRWLIAALRAHG